MKFGDFIKKCRSRHELTQEHLAEALYLYDNTLFHGIDTTAISKWERGITQPKIPKQLKILHFFRERQQQVFPCFDTRSVEENETLICQSGIRNLIVGRQKELVLNFPSNMMSAENLTIIHARDLEKMDALLEVTADMRNSVHPAYTQIDTQRLHEWALHPGSLFFVCRYKELVIGFLFILRVKPETVRNILRFETPYRSLTINDFADMKEDGSHLITHFFAWNDKAATMLMIRYYAHLIANQKHIREIGAAVYYEEAEKILANMNLKPLSCYSAEETRITSYLEELEQVLLSENVLKTVFQKETCPAE
jgi:transcriptional regulator with XRE-family HTH domain